MESIYPVLALCGRKNYCARTDTVFFPISEVSKGMVSLAKICLHPIFPISLAAYIPASLVAFIQ